MTIDAVHAAFEMNVVEMDCLAELRRIVRRNDIALRVEQVSFAIAFDRLSETASHGRESLQTACCAATH